MTKKKKTPVQDISQVQVDSVLRQYRMILEVIKSASIPYSKAKDAIVCCQFVEGVIGTLTPDEVAK